MPIERVLFSIFTVAFGAAVAAAMFGIGLYYRLFKRKLAGAGATMLTMIGIAIQSGILLALIIPTTAVRPSAQAYMYLVAVGVEIVGVVGLVQRAIKEVARQDVLEKTVDRLQSTQSDFRGPQGEQGKTGETGPAGPPGPSSR